MSNLLKTEYNLQLSIARAALTAASTLRATLIAHDPTLRGPSVQHLKDAVTSAYSARSFSGVANDLPAEDNTYRHNTKVGGRKTRERLASASPRSI